MNHEQKLREAIKTAFEEYAKAVGMNTVFQTHHHMGPDGKYESIDRSEFGDVQNGDVAFCFKGLLRKS